MKCYVGSFGCRVGVVRGGESRGIGINKDHSAILMDGIIVKDGLSCFPVLKLFEASALNSLIFVLCSLEWFKHLKCKKF